VRSCELDLIEWSGLDQARAPLLAQPIAVAADGDDVAVVQEAIEDGGCHHGVTEYLRVPLFRID